MEPTPADIEVYASEAVEKLRAAGHDLQTVRSAVADFFRTIRLESDPLVDALKNLSEYRNARDKIGAAIDAALSSLDAMAPTAAPAALAKHAALLRTMDDAVVRLDEFYEALCDPYLRTALDHFPLSVATTRKRGEPLMTRPQLVVFLANDCGLDDRHIAALFVYGTDGEAWAPAYATAPAPREQRDEDLCENFKTVWGNVRAILSRSETRPKRTKGRTRRRA